MIPSSVSARQAYNRATSLNMFECGKVPAQRTELYGIKQVRWSRKMPFNSAQFVPTTTLATGLPVDTIRGDFPLLATGGGAIAYLDNASSSLKPRAMIDRLQ